MRLRQGAGGWTGLVLEGAPVGHRRDAHQSREVVPEVDFGAEAALLGDVGHWLVGGLEQPACSLHSLSEQPLEGRGPRRRVEAADQRAGGDVLAACQVGDGERLVEVLQHPVEQRRQAVVVVASQRGLDILGLVPIIATDLAAGVAILPWRGRAGRGDRAGWRLDSAGTLLALGATGLVCTALTEAPGWPPLRTWLVLAAGLLLAAAFVARIRRHPDPVVAPRLFLVRVFSAGAAGLVAYYIGFAAMLLGTTLLLTESWHFSALRAAAGIAPGPITNGIVAPFSGRLAARLGVRRTVVTGAALFATAATWLLLNATADARSAPTYEAVILPSMLLWGLANALIQPTLFASAGAASRAELASGSAVLTTARHLGSALGVALIVAVLGSHPAADLPSLDRAWIVVLVAAAMTAAAGLAAEQRRIR